MIDQKIKSKFALNLKFTMSIVYEFGVSCIDGYKHSAPTLK